MNGAVPLPPSASEVNLPFLSPPRGALCGSSASVAVTSLAELDRPLYNQCREPAGLEGNESDRSSREEAPSLQRERAGDRAFLPADTEVGPSPGQRREGGPFPQPAVVEVRVRQKAGPTQLAETVEAR